MTVELLGLEIISHNISCLVRYI